MNATPSPKNLTVDANASKTAALMVATAPVAPPPAAPAPRRRRLGLMLGLPLALLVAGGGYWLTGGRYETTENAQLHQARIQIASSVAGRVVAVGITDNQMVKAGDLLFQVDPEPYKLALAQAETAVQTARLSVEQLKLSYSRATAEAKLSSDDAAYKQAELTRQQRLSSRGVTTDTTLDDARHEAQRAGEESDLAKQDVASALSALAGDANAPTDSHPTVQAALVARDAAQYALDITTISAPSDGVIYQAASFKPGQVVAAGQAQFALVETSDTWVEANLKETQLAGIKVGQPAEISFDLAPGKKFAAHVVAIGAGTGAEFSLLPAQNATGNWVKVTPRVPVRLEIDDTAALVGLSSGISASVSIDTGRKRSLSDLVPSAFGGL